MILSGIAEHSHTRTDSNRQQHNCSSCCSVLNDGRSKHEVEYNNKSTGRKEVPVAVARNCRDMSGEWRLQRPQSSCLKPGLTPCTALLALQHTLVSHIAADYSCCSDHSRQRATSTRCSSEHDYKSRKRTCHVHHNVSESKLPIKLIRGDHS